MDDAAKLIDTLSSATGLPNDLVEKELKSLIAQAGLNENHLTLEDLREVLANYLQDVILQAKNCYQSSPD